MARKQAAQARPPGTGSARQAVGRTQGGSRPRRHRAVIVLLSVTMLLGAALLFMVQPMLARLVLPLLGGSPAVWAASMLFFTAALLGGYLYAHLTTTWLGARRQAAPHLLLVAGSCATLPVGLPAGWVPPVGGNPTLWLLAMLAVAVGLPVVVLAATSPLLQRWLVDTDHPDAADPYFLYRASNAGSVAGLLAYPVVVEPTLGLAAQARLWSVAFAVFAVLLAACAVAVWRAPHPAPGPAPAPVAADPAAPGPGRRPGGPQTRPVTWPRRARWTALAFVPTSAYLGLTSFLTLDLAPMPLLWALPLGVYLLTMVVAFSRDQAAQTTRQAPARLLPVAAAVVGLLVVIGPRQPMWLIALTHLAGLFVVGLACHGRLAADRPAARSLTEFYGWVALGGALGAVFNGLVAPVVFESLLEYPLALVLACLLAPGRDHAAAGDRSGGRGRLPAVLGPARLRWRRTARRLGRRLGRRGRAWLDLVVPAALGAALLAVAFGLEGADAGDRERLAVYAAAVGACLALAGRPVRLGLTVAAVMVAFWVPQRAEAGVIWQDRNFFGVKQVEQVGDDTYRLLHGTTLHGVQIRSRRYERVPLTYYHPTGPLGRLLAGLPDRAVARRAALVGLGAGSTACLSRPGDRWTFYEIDPGVQRLASDPRLFTYLAECGQRDIVLGDARQTLARAADGEFGLIALDAFSSDAIPTHLVTREAVELYRDRLARRGVLALHVSNRYVQLEPVLGDIADAVGLACTAVVDHTTGQAPYKTSSHWVFMARRHGDLGHLGAAAPACDRSGGRVWTDDYANVLGALTLT